MEPKPSNNNICERGHMNITAIMGRKNSEDTLYTLAQHCTM